MLESHKVRIMKELSPDIVENLVAAAKQAQKNAYAPYSNFKVGAAVLTPGGDVYRGCNVENASYGLTICAERNAVFQAVASGEKEITALAIVTDAEEPSPPCGACRQVLVEFASDIPIILKSLNGKRVIKSLDDLLPHRFHLEE